MLLRRHLRRGKIKYRSEQAHTVIPLVSEDLNSTVDRLTVSNIFALTASIEILILFSQFCCRFDDHFCDTSVSMGPLITVMWRKSPVWVPDTQKVLHHETCFLYFFLFFFFFLKRIDAFIPVTVR